MIHSHITMNCLISIYLYQYSILLFYFNCSGIYIVVLYQGLNLHFFFDKCAWTSFSCIYCPYVYSFDYTCSSILLMVLYLLKLYTADVLYILGYKAFVKYIYILQTSLLASCSWCLLINNSEFLTQFNLNFII